ncbi:putative intron-encoded endonuclease [Botrytis fragariae]|uniref:Putative intron-encoded endonuclease n=1 Tax=Botrytis fragariae TaxID=1964551 RepID=A0A8H6EDZ0_9HELO|nr:putative intron-encoded endonuclease [Botrytis fragariae]KAF5868395.1 putative intron-encoded endonuclease [Botrytis fragariae]
MINRAHLTVEGVQSIREIKSAANQSSISALLTNRVGDCFLTVGICLLIGAMAKSSQVGLHV